jgi:hypothetical protein
MIMPQDSAGAVVSSYPLGMSLHACRLEEPSSPWPRWKRLPDVGSVTDVCSLLQSAKALYSIPPKIEGYLSFKICFIIKCLLAF